MEGYLQKRFKTGIVKTFKKKWFVLKDAELKSYQNEDAYRQNIEMYQECLPLYNIQTVRAASENLGVEVVTKHKTFILVASSATDQKQWIQAIYDMKKEHVPRPVSTSEETADKPRRKKSSGTSNGKSGTENRRKTSQFYISLDGDKAGRAEVGVQADVVQISNTAAEEDCTRPGGNESSKDRLPDETPSTEREMDAEQVGEASHRSSESEQGPGPRSDAESPADPDPVASSVNQPEDNARDQNDSAPRGNQEVNGVKQLELMLRMSTSHESEEAEEDEVCHGEDEDEDAFSDEDWMGEDIDSEGSIDEEDYCKEKENATMSSAFDTLKELLKT